MSTVKEELEITPLPTDNNKVTKDNVGFVTYHSDAIIKETESEKKDD